MMIRQAAIGALVFPTLALAQRDTNRLQLDWQITGMLADGSRRLVTVAKVTSYAINGPIEAGEFR